MVRNFVTKDTLPKFREQQLKEKETWEEFKRLSEEKDMKLFYEAYAKYLEGNLISEYRKIIYKMAKRVIKEVNNAT